MILAAAFTSYWIVSSPRVSTPVPSQPPKIAQRWTLATAWSRDLPILSDNLAKFADDVRLLSDGQLLLTIVPAGEATGRKGQQISPAELFDAVSTNEVQAIHAASYYWEKVPGAALFSAVPFGMNHEQQTEWLEVNGGLTLWRELYARYNLVPFPCGSSGPQMGGWFKREINRASDFRGLRMRIPGLGGRVLEREGALTFNVPQASILRYADQDRIDAAEWIGPYHDHVLELFRIGRYYYEPGWQEPNVTFEFTVNKTAYDTLSPQLQHILLFATRTYHQTIYREFVSKNREYRPILLARHVEFRQFPPAVLGELRREKDAVMDEYVRGDATGLSKRIYESYQRSLHKTTQNAR